MTRLFTLLVTAGLLCGIVLITGCCCSIETNRDRARATLRIAHSKQLLVAMEKYRSRLGRLPSSLEELRESDAEVRNVDLTHYTYRPEGFVVADGTRWILSTPDPYRKGQLIVGKLPMEVESNKTPKADSDPSR